MLHDDQCLRASHYANHFEHELFDIQPTVAGPHCQESELRGDVNPHQHGLADLEVECFLNCVCHHDELGVREVGFAC